MNHNIVLEGPDGSGKSTLAKTLSAILDIPIKGSEGPPHYDGEINDRIRRYLDYDRRYIFDRHPCVSQPIYGTIRSGKRQTVNDELVREFYRQKNLFIYCRTEDLSRHVVKAYDSKEHLEQIERNAADLLSWYDMWANANAHMVFRMGQDHLPLVHYILAAIGDINIIPHDDAA